MDFPLNLIYLASGLNQSRLGISATPLDLTFEHLRRKFEGAPLLRAQELCVERTWAEQGPFDIVGIGGLCDNFHLSVRLAEFVKKKFSVPLVMGGPQATFVAKELLSAFPFLDFVISNDGIGPLLKLCESLAGQMFEKVPALTFRDRQTEEIRQNPRTDCEFNIMNVRPDYGLLPLAEYLAINPECSIPVLAGAGCPFQCTYCSTSLMWDRRYKILPPEVIADQILALKKRFPSARYSLVHDNLLFGKDFARRLCTALAKTRVKWGCSSRLEHLGGDHALMRNLKSAGCEVIFIGIETGSPRMQKLMGKNIDVLRVVPFAQDLVRHGLSAVFSFIVGFPEETDRDRDKTLRLAFYLRKLQAERVNINHLFPLPGTAIARNNPVSAVRARSYRAPQLLADRKTKKLVFRNPEIFRSFWSFADMPGNTPLVPLATERLHRYGVEHYRSFNYLFSRAGIPPSALFPLLGKKGSRQYILKGIKALAGPRHYRIFSEIFRYESLLMKMLENRSCDSPSLSGRAFDEGAKYLLSSRINLFQSPLHLPSYLESEEGASPAAAEERRTFFCLVDGGKRIETYEIRKEIFLILKAMSGTGSRARTLLREVRDDRVRKNVARSLKMIFKMGVLSDV